jgi:nucleoside-diphosphate-sugar epimerase
MRPSKPPPKAHIVITGAAGLVGQNLAALLHRRNDLHVIAIDKHEVNLQSLSGRLSAVEPILADLALPGDWEKAVQTADVVVQLHMQAKGKTAEPFERNNIAATRRVLAAMHRAHAPFLVHVSSAAVHSKATDCYTETKTRQEAMVRQSGIDHCVLRPTLMYGRYDPKHLGWLARFMAKVPLFPVPGDGRFVRQPLYVMDFCRIIAVCIERQPSGALFDITGPEKLDYIDIIREIRRTAGHRTLLVKLPIPLFRRLLDLFAVFVEDPPFTSDQLAAITVGDLFDGVDIKRVFGVSPTPFSTGALETFAFAEKQPR